MPDAVRTKWGIPIWVWVVGGLVAVGWLAWSISGTLAIVAASFLLAYALDPLVDRLVCWRVPRGLAIAVVLTVILLAVTLVVVLILPRVIREISAFVVAFPALVERTWQNLEPWLREQGFEVPRTYGELGQSLNGQSGGLPERVASAAGNVVSWVAGSTVSVANWIMTVALVPVLTFYLLYSLDDMRESSVSYIPERHRPAVIELARDIDQVVAQFIRGQLLVMLFLAVAYSTHRRSPPRDPDWHSCWRHLVYPVRRRGGRVGRGAFVLRAHRDYVDRADRRGAGARHDPGARGLRDHPAHHVGSGWAPGVLGDRGAARVWGSVRAAGRACRGPRGCGDQGAPDPGSAGVSAERLVQCTGRGPGWRGRAAGTKLVL
jgi:hypothetical protein